MMTNLILMSSFLPLPVLCTLIPEPASRAPLLLLCCPSSLPVFVPVSQSDDKLHPDVLILQLGHVLLNSYPMAAYSVLSWLLYRDDANYLLPISPNQHSYTGVFPEFLNHIFIIVWSVWFFVTHCGDSHIALCTFLLGNSLPVMNSSIIHITHCSQSVLHCRSIPQIRVYPSLFHRTFLLSSSPTFAFLCFVSMLKYSCVFVLSCTFAPPCGTHFDLFIHNTYWCIDVYRYQLDFVGIGSNL